MMLLMATRKHTGILISRIHSRTTITIQMTSIAQFNDINEDPFIVKGRSLIDNMKIQVGITGVQRLKGSGFFETRSVYLYFPAKGFTPIYSDFLIKAFADKIDCHPPVKISMKDGEYMSIFFKDNLHIVSEKPTPHFWDKENSLKVKAEIQAHLNKYLIQFFYDYLCF